MMQLEDGFMHPTINCEETHPEILKNIDDNCIVKEYEQKDIEIIAKPSFGFGDVNSCLYSQKILIMERQEIKEKLTGIIKPYVQNEAAFAKMTEDTNLLMDLEVNSAHLVDIILDMEESFDIEIDDDAAEEMMTVGEAINISEKLIRGKKEA
ncbi:MAG: phosphopantetheine-binding protein [Owenweeksia sp.]|nr:phosphopantetheine-binding protein [Owenweeksia sp.]